MEKIIINEKEYIVPTKWDDITFLKYNEIFYDLIDGDVNDEIINIKNEVKIISRIIGIEEGELLNSPLPFFEELRKLFYFIYKTETEFYKDSLEYIILNNKKYIVVPHDKMPLRQYIDIDMTLSEPSSPTKLIEVLAISMVEEGKEYDGNYEQRFEMLKNIKALEGISLLSFFLLKGKILIEDSLHYSTLEEEVNQLLQPTQAL